MARKNKFTAEADTLAGKKVMERRLCMGLSRGQLADMIDVTHQQLQKYENGTNRITFGRMMLIAAALDKPIEYFGDQIPLELPDQHQRLCIEVSRNFLKIKNPRHRRAVGDLVRQLSVT
ncbi:MAG: helix-turn-helix transcriptional regulator [Candidatus Bathyarchaeia archaeon]